MAAARQLPYVDPYKPRGRLYFTVARLSATKLGAWFSINVAWKLDPLLDRVFPEYADYRERAARAGREIPIFQLLPR